MTRMCEFHHSDVTIILLEVTSFCVNFIFKLVAAAVNPAIYNLLKGMSFVRQNSVTVTCLAKYKY